MNTILCNAFVMQLDSTLTDFTVTFLFLMINTKKMKAMSVCDMIADTECAVKLAWSQRFIRGKFCVILATTICVFGRKAVSLKDILAEYMLPELVSGVQNFHKGTATYFMPETLTVVILVDPTPPKKNLAMSSGASHLKINGSTLIVQKCVHSRKVRKRRPAFSGLLALF